MANGLFLAYREGILGEYTTWVDLNNDTLRVAFIDEAAGPGAPDLAADDFFDDIDGGEHPAGNYNTAGQTTDSPTIGVSAAGAFDIANETFAAFSNGSVSVEGIILWKEGAAAASSPLIAYWNTGVTGLPFTPTGGDVTISWHTSGLFSI